jgi:molybdopterin biosynthesis enzyme MoaB
MVITISDGVAAGATGRFGRGSRESPPTARLRVDRGAVPDERAAIEAALNVGTADHALIVTTGGTALRLET